MSLVSALMACSDHHEHIAATIEGQLKNNTSGRAWKARKRMYKHTAFAFACAKAAEIVAKKGGGGMSVNTVALVAAGNEYEAARLWNRRAPGERTELAEVLRGLKLRGVITDADVERLEREGVE